MATIREMLQELEMEAPTTRRALERVREDRLDWKPHEKSMTMGVLAMHVATIPAMLGEVARTQSAELTPMVARIEHTFDNGRMDRAAPGDGGAA